MRKLFGLRAKRPGLAPGTVEYHGETRQEPVKIAIIDYTVDEVVENGNASISECVAKKDTPTVSWINVTGVHDVSIINELGREFGLHPLVLEDIVNMGQMAKTEDYDDYIFSVVKMFQIKQGQLVSENVSVAFGKNYVLSFQEVEGDVFEPIRNRIREGRKRLRYSNTDYLGYTLIDAIVDNYYVVLDHMGEKITALEDRIAESPNLQNRTELQNLKEQLLVMQKAIGPLRRSIPALTGLKSDLIHEENQPYFRDLVDHTIQVIELIDAMRNKLAEINDFYLTVISTKTNEVMKVLSIVATIFIPLSFIAGLYGTNFRYVPELEWEGSYFVMLAGMSALGAGMLLFFKKKGWL